MFLINVKNNRSDFITLIPLILSGCTGTRLWPISSGQPSKAIFKIDFRQNNASRNFASVRRIRNWKSNYFLW